MSKFERVKIYFVSPPEMEMKADILEHLDEHDVWYALEHDAAKVLREVDVVYQTRIRPERLADRGTHGRYTIDATVLQTMKRDALILHPLPRTVEIDKAVDEDPRAPVLPAGHQRAVRADGAADDAVGRIGRLAGGSWQRTEEETRCKRRTSSTSKTSTARTTITRSTSSSRAPRACGSTTSTARSTSTAWPPTPP